MKVAKIGTLSTRIKAQARAQKMAQKEAAEAKLRATCRRVAKSVLSRPQHLDISIYDGTKTGSSVKKQIQEYLTKLTDSSGDWAPWNKNFIKSK